VRVYGKHYVRQRQNNLTTFFNFNEREVIRPIVFLEIFIVTVYAINIFIIPELLHC
jgi:hypothetical protein